MTEMRQITVGAADFQRAAATMRHYYVHESPQGVQFVIDQAIALDRLTELLYGLLHLHTMMLPLPRYDDAHLFDFSLAWQNLLAAAEPDEQNLLILCRRMVEHYAVGDLDRVKAGFAAAADHEIGGPELICTVLLIHRSLHETLDDKATFAEHLSNLALQFAADNTEGQQHD